MCDVAECHAGGVGSVISMVGGGLPSGVATRGGRPRRATWIHLAIVIPGNDADSDVGCVIRDDRIAVAKERMFAHRRALI